MRKTLRLAFVQHGDYAEAYRRFAKGGAETYYAQRYSVGRVAEFAARAEFAGVCSISGAHAERDRLNPRFEAARLGPHPSGKADIGKIVELLEEWRPTRLILRTPSPALVFWALRRRIDILPIFADSWENLPFRSRVKTRLLGLLLNNWRIPLVGNHNVPASLSMNRIGVAAEKIFPWDWPHALTPDQYPAKSLNAPPRLLFIGHLSEAKGANDCFRAAEILASRNVEFQLRMIGAGPLEDRLKADVERLGLRDRVVVCGRMDHDAVVRELEAASLALAPSRHAYGEGLPMTIYEALATRTPLVMSDHPMFELFFKNAPAARMVPEADPAAMADAIETMLNDKEAYEAASAATIGQWYRITCKLTWGKLVETWLQDPEGAPAALAGMNLKSALAAQEKRKTPPGSEP